MFGCLSKFTRLWRRNLDSHLMLKKAGSSASLQCPNQIRLFTCQFRPSPDNSVSLVFEEVSTCCGESTRRQWCGERPSLKMVWSMMCHMSGKRDQHSCARKFGRDTWCIDIIMWLHGGMSGLNFKLEHVWSVQTPHAAQVSQSYLFSLSSPGPTRFQRDWLAKRPCLTISQKWSRYTNTRATYKYRISESFSSNCSHFTSDPHFSKWVKKNLAIYRGTKQRFRIVTCKFQHVQIWGIKDDHSTAWAPGERALSPVRASTNKQTYVLVTSES